jgi:ribose/xylose/arabinose/galactoside ABC-type transport system permease subunit
MKVRAAIANGTVLALLALVALNAVLTPHFFTIANALNVGLQVTTTVWVGIGMTMVMATGSIDLSVGSVMALGSVVTTLLLPSGIPLTICGGLAVATAVGLANGVFVARFGILPIIVTLAMAIMVRGVALLLVEGSNAVAFSSPSFEYLGNGHLLGVPFPVLLALVTLGVSQAVMRRTTFGRHVVAVGGNERAARLAGVPVRAIKTSVYVLSGFLAGLAGIVATARLSATDAGRMGQGVELDAIAATVIGGTSFTGGQAKLGGTLLGALIMAVVTASMNMHLVPHAWTMVLTAVIVILAVALQRAREA